MPGQHHEWAFQIPFSSLPVEARSGRWRVFVVARVEKQEESPLALSAGVYDAAASHEALSRPIASNEVSDKYKTIELGTIDANASQYLWVAPPGDSRVKAVWVDRIVLVKAADRLD